MSRRRVLYYAVRHKWFVFWECYRTALEINEPSLIWRGVVHDWDKFIPWMVDAYSERFGNDIRMGRDETGYYDPHADKYTKPRFTRAFLHHVRRNKHHWQWWVEATEQGELVHPMPRLIAVEMVCDWVGAAKAQGFPPDPCGWFEKNRNKMRLHDETVHHVVEELKRRY